MSDYCTLADVRAEDLPVSVASDARVTALITEMSALIDRVTGWWFEPRAETQKIDGTGTPYLHLQAPATAVTEVRRVWRAADPDSTFVIDDDSYVIYSYETPTQRHNPHLRLIVASDSALVIAAGVSTDDWVVGSQNYEIDGTFGFVDDDGAGSGTTPEAIKRACIMLVIHNARPLWETMSGQDAAYERRTGDLRSHSVQGRSATWGGPSSSGSATGLNAVDQILAFYRRPIGMVAA